MRMRITGLLSLVLICLGCADAPSVAPRAYLDERTAATITVVAEPWIFAREDANATIDQRDVLNLYAINVNRMGDHRQYFAALQSLPPRDAEGRELSPTLELRVGGEVVSFSPSAENPHELGVAQPVAKAYTLGSRWWFFPVRKDVLAGIATSADVQAALVFDGVRKPYVLWRDGRAEAEAFMSALP